MRSGRNSPSQAPYSFGSLDRWEMRSGRNVGVVVVGRGAESRSLRMRSGWNGRVQPPLRWASLDRWEMRSGDIVIVTGDAYVDHPSFGMAVIGRVLEAQGFSRGHHRAARLAQRRALPRAGPAQPVLRVVAGNMDSMINRYTADRKIRSDDAYTPGGVGGRAPTAPPGLHPALPRGLQGRAHRHGRHRGQLRRIATTTTGQDKVRRSILVDARPTCCCTATPSAPSSRSPTAWPPASRSSASPTCAAPPSCAAWRPVRAQGLV